MPASLMLFVLWGLGLLIIYCFVIKTCVGVDDLCKSNYNEKKMYKYKRWMSFTLIFRSCEDTSDNPIKRKLKIHDETNMEHISKLSFWLQIINLIIAICLIIFLGVYREILESIEYVRLIMIVFWSYVGYAGCFFVLVLIPTIVIEVKGRKRSKERKSQEDTSMQQPIQTEESAPPVEETSLDQLAPTTASDSDNYNPYLQ